MNQAPSSKSAFQITGDVADPSGTGARGMSAGYDLSTAAIGHPVIWWKGSGGEEKLLTFDVYAPPDAPKYIMIHCPVCALAGRKKEAIRIIEGHKAFEYDPLTPPPMYPGWSDTDVYGVLVTDGIDIKGGGRLSTEPFRCTWDEKPDLKRAFGLQQCTWHVSITNNVAKNA